MGRVRVSFDFEGIKDAQEAIRKFGEEGINKVERATQSGLDAGFQRANIDVSVKTGKLKRSIKKTKNTLEAGGSEAPYAPFVERKKPFMVPAIEDAIEEFNRELNR